MQTAGELIGICAENNGYIVCRDKETAHNIFIDAKNKELNINFPITYEELIDGRVGNGTIYIDDADGLLTYLCRGRKLAAITTTVNDVSLNFK